MTQGTFLYFAYGSNMLTARLQERCNSARPIGPGHLVGHRLAWHKKSRDGSGKCDAESTDDGAHLLHGVLFELKAIELTELDRFEGAGNGYERRAVTVRRLGEPFDDVWTYCATDVVRGLRPYTWYRDYVLHGAREHGLPAPHVGAIRAIDAMIDSDQMRHAREVQRLANFGILRP